MNKKEQRTAQILNEEDYNNNNKKNVNASMLVRIYVR